MSFQSLRTSFLAGLLALLPLFITWRILLFLFQLVDGPLGSKINMLLQRLSGNENLHIPGLGVLCTILIVLGIGWMTRLMFFRNILREVEALIERVPVVSSLYNASRQIVVPFTDKSKLPFSKVVLAEYPMVGRYTLGLLAREKISDDPNDDRVVVFFPSNHLHLGYPVMLSRHDLHVIDMTVEEAVKFFVSCGVVGDDHIVRSSGVYLKVGQKVLSGPAPVELREDVS